VNLQVKILGFIVSALLITGCGGGGGGGGSTTTTSTLSFPVAQAIAYFISNSHNYNVTASGTMGGNNITGSGTLSYSAAVVSTFEGQPALKQTVTITGNLTANSSTVPYAFTGENYYDTNYNPVGSSLAGGTDYCVAASFQAYPSSVKVGNTDTIGTDDCYQDSSKSVSTENDVKSYLVEADTATSAIVNLITNSYSLTSALQSSDQSRYRINSSGNITLISSTVTDYTVSPATVLKFTVQ